MIRIKIDNIDDISTWYKDQVLPLVIDRKVNQTPMNSYERIVYKYLNMEFFCSDILNLPVTELLVKYDWIRDYKQTIDFCTFTAGLDTNISQIKGTGARTNRANRMKEYYNRYDNDWMEKILESFCNNIDNKEDRIKSVTKFKKSFKSFVKDVKEKIESLNRIICEKVDYESVLGNSKIRGELANKLDIRVCPYCNRQYINPVTYDGEKKYLGDIDHILPKSTYALFQLNFYNMIPACKVCNQLFKKNKALDILNPYFEGFDDDVYLKMRYSSVKEMIGLEKPSDYSWVIDSEKTGIKRTSLKATDKSSRINNNLEIFRLDDVYNTNAKEFQRVLRLKYIYESPIYRNNIVDIFNNGIDGNLDRFDERLIYGVSLDENNFQNEILSKAIYDIVYRN